MGSERALHRDRPHFHPRSVIEARHALCDRRRLLEAARGQQQVTSEYPGSMWVGGPTPFFPTPEAGESNMKIVFR
jgi:hypothetical protein